MVIILNGIENGFDHSILVELRIYSFRSGMKVLESFGHRLDGLHTEYFAPFIEELCEAVAKIQIADEHNELFRLALFNGLSKSLIV